MEPTTTIIDTRGTDTLSCLEAIRTALRLSPEPHSFVIRFAGGNDHIASGWWVSVTTKLAQEANTKLKIRCGRGRILVEVLP